MEDYNPFRWIRDAGGSMAKNLRASAGYVSSTPGEGDPEKEMATRTNTLENLDLRKSMGIPWKSLVGYCPAGWKVAGTPAYKQEIVHKLH